MNQWTSFGSSGSKAVSGTGDGPYRNNKLFNMWENSVYDVFKEYEEVFDKGTTLIIEEREKKDAGKALREFMLEMLDGDTLYKSDGRDGGGAQKKAINKYFDIDEAGIKPEDISVITTVGDDGGKTDAEVNAENAGKIKESKMSFTKDTNGVPRDNKDLVGSFFALLCKNEKGEKDTRYFFINSVEGGYLYLTHTRNTWFYQKYLETQNGPKMKIVEKDGVIYTIRYLTEGKDRVWRYEDDVYEVDDDSIHPDGACPVEPVFHSGLEVDCPEPVRLCRVQLVDNVIRRSIDCRKDAGLRVELPAIQLAVQGDLHGRLENLLGGSIVLIQEESPGILAAIHEPVRGTEAGDTVRELRKAEEVAFRHLAEPAVDQLKSQLISDLLEDLGLTDAVGATDHDADVGGELRGDVHKSLDIHEILLGSLVGLVILPLLAAPARDRCDMHEALDEVEAEAAPSLQSAAGCHELQLSGLTTHRRGPVVVLGTHDLDQAIEAHGPFAADSEHEEDVDSADDGRHLVLSERGDSILNESVHPISLRLHHTTSRFCRTGPIKFPSARYTYCRRRTHDTHSDRRGSSRRCNARRLC
jgi:hypothetical protein